MGDKSLDAQCLVNQIQKLVQGLCKEIPRQHICNYKCHDEYEKYCYMCRRPESETGKLINFAQNVYICPDCLQKTLNQIQNSPILDITNMYIINIINNKYN